MTYVQKNNMANMKNKYYSGSQLINAVETYRNNAN